MTTRQRILVLGRANYPLVRRRAELLAARGHDVRIGSVQEGDPLPSVQVDTLAGLGDRTVRYMTALPDLLRRTSGWAPDVVDGHGATSYGFLASLLPRRGGRRLLTLYGTDIYAMAQSSPPLKVVARRALASADVIYGSSPTVATAADEVLGVDITDRFISAPWGVRTDIAPELSRRPELRRREGVDDDTLVILHPRRIFEHWRVDFIIESIHRAQRLTDRPIELWMVYTPPTPDEEVKLAKLREHADRLGVTLVEKGPQPYERLLDLQLASDVFVCAARDEMLANSLLEAMLCGSIPVLSDIDAFRLPAAWDGTDLRLCDVDDPDAWAEAIASVAAMDDVERRHREVGNRRSVMDHADDRVQLDWLWQQLDERG